VVDLWSAWPGLGREACVWQDPLHELQWVQEKVWCGCLRQEIWGAKRKAEDMETKAKDSSVGTKAKKMKTSRQRVPMLYKAPEGSTALTSLALHSIAVHYSSIAATHSLRKFIRYYSCTHSADVICTLQLATVCWAII